MKNLLFQIVKSLVDNPEQVQVNENVSAQTVMLELKVANAKDIEIYDDIDYAYIIEIFAPFINEEFTNQMFAQFVN